jgi:two-component system, chemotaxis family, sensor histidine kinase and response regulator PixL
MCSSSVQPKPVLLANGAVAELAEGRRILIIDDCLTTCRLVSLTLQSAGYRILQASDGHDALTQLRRHRDIDLVICDGDMPRMNGLEFLNYCQHDSCFCRIPIVMHTAQSSPRYRVLVENLGAAAYLTKPCPGDQLLDVIGAVLERTGVVHRCRK